MDSKGLMYLFGGTGNGCADGTGGACCPCLVNDKVVLAPVPHPPLRLFRLGDRLLNSTVSTGEHLTRTATAGYGIGSQGNALTNCVNLLLSVKHARGVFINHDGYPDEEVTKSIITPDGLGRGVKAKRARRLSIHHRPRSLQIRFILNSCHSTIGCVRN